MNIQRRQLIGSAVAGTALSVTPLVKAAVKEEKADSSRDFALCLGTFHETKPRSCRGRTLGRHL